MKMKSSIYLATAYSHKLETVRYDRFERVNEAAAYLMEQGHIVFSPISHSHPIAEYVDKGLSCQWDFWRPQDFFWLNCCDEMFILTQDGWKESEGVNAEIIEARRVNKPIFLLTPDTWELEEYKGGANGKAYD